MKARLLFFSIFSFLIIQTSQSQTVIPEGEVFGNWLNSASPYLIEGEVNIPLDKTLIIEPGVEVKFNGHYKFIIYGCLLAEGTSGDSIIFTTDDHETGWHGLRFTDTETNSQPISKVTFCVVEYGKSFGTCPDNSGAGIYIGHSRPVISHSSIRNNTAVSGAGEWGGGGIYSEFSAPEIHDNHISGNSSGHDGGGIYCGYGSPVISNNIIVNNQAGFRGGGIATFSSASPDILNNEIASNLANSKGGGMYLSGGNSLVQSNIIKSNYSGDGGGIACYLSNPRIYNNLIIDNEANKGGGLSNLGSSPKLFNNTILRNYASSNGGGMVNMAGMVGVLVYSNPLTANNILYLNLAMEGPQIYSNPDNIPILWHNDVEGFLADGIFGSFDEQEGNIDITPDFDSEGEHDCALSDGSECIDNGINNISGFSLPETDILGNKRIWDGNDDGHAYADMGAYEFGSSPLGIIDNGIIMSRIDVAVSPNPFVNVLQLSFEMEHQQQITLSIYNLSGKQLDVLVNENLGRGEHQLSFALDWLPAGIYFLNLKTDKGLTSTKKIIKITE